MNIFNQFRKKKFRIIDSPAAGTWSRDCELISLSGRKNFKLFYHKDEDDTYWNLRCEGVVAYKVTGEEFPTTINLSIKGVFFEILNSPWMCEFEQEQPNILDKCQHYVLKMYDETIEIIAQKFIFEQLPQF